LRLHFLPDSCRWPKTSDTRAPIRSHNPFCRVRGHARFFFHPFVIPTHPRSIPASEKVIFPLTRHKQLLGGPYIKPLEQPQHRKLGLSQSYPHTSCFLLNRFHSPDVWLSNFPGPDFLTFRSARLLSHLLHDQHHTAANLPCWAGWSVKDKRDCALATWKSGHPIPLRTY
jgi:hypothetical protein